MDNRPILRLSPPKPDATPSTDAIFPMTDYAADGSHVHGGSGSLVVEEGEESSAMWIGEEELSSFETNVPDEAVKPIKNHVVCCTGNPVIQVAVRGGSDRIEPAPPDGVPAARTGLASHHQAEDVDSQVHQVLSVGLLQAC